MGLLRKGKEWLAGKVAARQLDAWSRDIERWRAKVALEEMSMKTFLRALGVAFLGGVAAAGADAIGSGGFSFAPEALWHLGAVSIAGGLVAAAMYLKQSPLPKKDS
jgi:hypothetical protein